MTDPESPSSPAAPSPQGPEEKTTVLTDGPDLDDGAPSSTSGERSTSPSRLYIAAAGVLVVVLVAALVAPRLFGSDDDGGATDSDVASVTDDFERSAENGLGAVDGQRWEEVSGTFAIDDGVAVVDQPNDAGPRTVTLVDGGATNARIEAIIGQATPAWGLVFRYADPFNYWYVQAAPDYAVLNVVRMVNGEPQLIGASDLARLADGVAVVVNLDGTAIEIEVDGEVVFLLTNDHCLGATKAGLLGLGDPEGASWEKFSITPNADDPGPTAIILPPVETSTTDTDETTTTTFATTTTTSGSTTGEPTEG